MRKVLIVVGIALFASAFLPGIAQAADLKLSGFGQVWYVYSDTGSGSGTTGTQNSDSYFAVKRFRLKATGNITENDFVSYFSQIDFVGGAQYNQVRNDPNNDKGTAANGGTMTIPILLDFWINLKFWDFFQLRAGQFIIPFGYEGPRSPYDLELLTYSLVYGTGQSYPGMSVGFFPYLRDLGAYIHGNYKGFNYKVGLVNGQGFYQNDIILLHGNKWKDIVGRVGYDYGKMLSAGISGYFGMEDSYTNIDQDRRKWRAGLDVKFDYANALVVFEYIVGQTEQHNTYKENLDPAHFYFTPLTAQGLYLLGAYTIKTKAGDIQPALRFDWWQNEAFTNNGGTKNPAIYAFTGGVNYIFYRNEKNPKQNAKISAVYERILANGEARVLASNVGTGTTPIVQDYFILQLGAEF